MDRYGEPSLVWIEAEDLASEFLAAPFPPREARGSLGPLVRSMRKNGCICPIIARPAAGKLQVVCGYRRLMAAQAARLEAVPILVRDLTDDECRRLFAEENSHRIPHGGQEPAQWEDQAATLRRIVEKRRKVSMGRGLAAALPLPIAPEEPAFQQCAGNWLAGTEAQVLPAVLGGILGADSQAPAQGPSEPETAQSPRLCRGTISSEVGVGRDLPDLAMLALVNRTEACFESIRATRAIPIEDVERIASDLIAMAPVRRGRDLRVFGAGSYAGSIFSHSLLVAGLGIHLAGALEWTPGQIKKFALACLLHDVGMLFIPPELLDAPRALERSERELVERHTEIGGEIIQGSHAWGAQIRLVAQEHHERWNGMGYPGRKKGKEVDLPSRMVAFLDCFGALVSPRPFRAPLLYSQALRAMAALTEIGFHDPSILVHFRNVFTELPVGCCLRLKDGRIGRIVGRDPRDPRRYRLRVLDGSSAFRPEPPVWIDSESISSEIHPLRSADQACPKDLPVPKS